MTVTFSRDRGPALRAYRVECPDHARISTDQADSPETILIPGPEHRTHPERSVWLRIDDAIAAAREGRYGLRLVAEEDVPRATAAGVPVAPSGEGDPGGRLVNRRLLLALGLAAWAAGPAPVGAAGTGDPRFPEAISAAIGGRTVRLALTGTALRTKYRFRVYAVASYAPEGLAIPGPEALAALDAPKLLHLIFERDVDGPAMAGAFRESIGRGHPAPAFAAEMAALERHFVANPVVAGDHVRLTHVPGVGLGVQVNARPVMVIRGVGFARAAWGTYLGPEHLGAAIKAGLTSRLR